MGVAGDTQSQPMRLLADAVCGLRLSEKRIATLTGWAVSRYLKGEYGEQRS